MNTAAHGLWSQLSVSLCEVWKLRVIQHWRKSRSGIQEIRGDRNGRKSVWDQRGFGWFVSLVFRVSPSISVVPFLFLENTYISLSVRCQIPTLRAALKKKRSNSKLDKSQGFVQLSSLQGAGWKLYMVTWHHYCDSFLKSVNIGIDHAFSVQLDWTPRAYNCYFGRVGGGDKKNLTLIM